MKAIYDSHWHNPILFLVAGVAFLAFAVARGLPFLRAYALLFTIEIMADALLTGGWSPLGQGASVASALAVVFVVLGDWRYFLLLERYARRGPGRLPFGLLSLLASLVVPIVSTVLRRAGPAAWQDSPRVLFLIYELLFAVIAAVIWLRLRAWAWPGLDPRLRPWAVALTGFEIVQYVGWATADVFLLFEAENVGYALRLVPNIMYYVLFIPFAWFRAPREAHTS